MRRLEYHIEQIEFKDGKPRDKQLLEVLNRLGKEGWRVSSLVVEPRVAVDEKGLRVLLERRAGKAKKTRTHTRKGQRAAGT